MSTPLKTIFDELYSGHRFDLPLAKRISRYVGDLMNRNEEHVMFFGSSLTGVYDLRFKTTDRNEWFIDIKDVDEFELKKRILKESVYDPTWVRANDAFNLDCLYTMHRYLISDLPQNQKIAAVDIVGMALNIKLLGSIMAAYFPYKCDERIAQEVYARLSRKFHIKKFGSWKAVLENRSHDICFSGTKSSWLEVLTDFTDDEAIAQCISDIQGRLRSMIKYVWSVLEQVKADDAKFGRTNATVEIEGDKVIQSLKRNPDKFLRYSQEIVLDRHTFIKPEIAVVVNAEMRTMSQKLLIDLLEHVVFCANRKEARIEKLINASIQHTINTISGDRTASRNMADLSWLLNKEKLLFMASKTNDALVFEARDIAEGLVREACKTKNGTMIASLKTGLIIYIIARTFSMEYYLK